MGGSTVGNFVRGATDVATFGTAEIGGVSKKLGNMAATGSMSGPSSLTQQGYTDNPAQTLAQSGGAPLLANVALGVDPKSAIAGYFGADDYDKFYAGLSDSDKKLVSGVTNQLTQIQTNTNLRNNTVQSIVNDFPNIAAKAAQDRKASGDEFDATTKGYLDQALNATAAKYAAGGSVSSGAMNEASAKVGAQYGMDKLNYMDNRGDASYAKGVQGWQAQYNEANALRNFQNTMTGNAAGQGFSAVQAALNRTQQTNGNNATFANQDSLQKQKSSDALFGAIGGLAGTALMGPAGGLIGRAAASGATTGGSNYQPAFPQGSPTMNQPINYPMSSPRLNLGY